MNRLLDIVDPPAKPIPQAPDPGVAVAAPAVFEVLKLLAEVDSDLLRHGRGCCICLDCRIDRDRVAARGSGDEQQNGPAECLAEGVPSEHYRR